MLEKVKVSREVAEALQTVLPNGNISGCIEKHVQGWDYEPKLHLKKLTTEEFAKCCLIGYEVEETPEEITTRKILDAWNSHEDETWKYDVGWKNGAKFILNELGCKIKGIND